jgi:glutathione S-transferase
MIILYGFGPKFDLPEASPFVMKTEVQLKMAGLPYRLERATPPDGPKGKLPFIRDGERVIGDSTFIRAHIEHSCGVDLEAGLDARQRAAGWAIERMLEDHLYWALLHLRWGDDANFAKGPIQFLARLPEADRPKGRAQLLDRIRVHGLARHTGDEIAALSVRSVTALAEQLGEQPFLFGDAPSAVDATAFAMAAAVATAFFDGPLTRAARGHANLLAYIDRMMARYYPGFAWWR